MRVTKITLNLYLKMLLFNKKLFLLILIINVIQLCYTVPVKEIFPWPDLDNNQLLILFNKIERYEASTNKPYLEIIHKLNDKYEYDKYDYDNQNNNNKSSSNHICANYMLFIIIFIRIY